MEQLKEGKKLLVFIGEKVDFKTIPIEPDSMYYSFAAKYKVLETICGDYNKEVINLIIYDNIDTPILRKYKNIMLFAKQDNDTFYQSSFYYIDVYKTKDGKWAAPYSANDYKESENTIIKPVKIEFEDEVSYSIEGLSKKEIKIRYPQPYYIIRNWKAIAVWGNYATEAFQLKKEGEWKHDFWDNSDSTVPVELTLLDMRKLDIPTVDSLKLLATWRIFLNAIRIRDTNKIKQMSLSSMKCSLCEGIPADDFYNDTEPIDSFVANAYTYLPNSLLWERMIQNKFDVWAYEYPDSIPENFQLKEGNKLVVYSINFETLTEVDQYRNLKQTHEFQFVKINSEYTFYGMESQSNSWSRK